MMTNHSQSEIETMLEKARDGYTGLAGRNFSFLFEEQELGCEEVVGRFQKSLDLFTEVRRTRTEYELAVEAHRRAIPGMKRFHGEAMKVARHHFGGDAQVMATFGVTSPVRAKRRRASGHRDGGVEVVTTVIEEVIVERDEAKRGCHHRRGGGRRRSVPGEPLQVVGSSKKQRCQR